MRLYNSLFSSDLLKYNNLTVQCLTWIADWAIIVLDYAKSLGSTYFQIDASFMALKPYVYCVPMLIIQNAPIPLGLVLDPSESHYLFLKFFDYIEKYIDCINSFPVLSDQGTAIISYCKSKNINQYFCYRHLIEKLGSGSLIGIFAKNLLFSPTIEIYEIKLIQYISDINLFIEKGIITEKQIKKFVQIFELEFSNGIITQSNTTDFQNALWNRSLLGISTCSNHIERLHRTLNEKTSGKRSIIERLFICINEINNYYINFEKNSRKQAKSLLNKLIKKAKKNKYDFKKCPFDCHWGEIYSN